MKKRILLTKPKKGNYPLGYKLYSPMIPMGIGFLANTLAKAGHELKIVDNYLASFKQSYWDKDVFIKKLVGFNPDYIGISFMSIEFKEALELIDICRQYSNARIIVGGPHPSLIPDSIAPYVDLVVVGEGEQAIVDIVEGEIDHRYMNGKIISYPPIAHLDNLLIKDGSYGHMIPWECFNIPEYDIKLPNFGLDEGLITNMNTSRGCPFTCKFCSVAGIWGKGSYRCFSSWAIGKEIKFLCEKLGIKRICFREDNFTASRGRVLNLCNFIIKNKLEIEWAAESRVDCLDDELVKIMSNSGCKGLLLGVESGSNRMLHKMRKTISVTQTKRAFELCHNYGINTYASIIYGLPEETEEDREATERLIKEIQPCFTEISIYLGIPGSEYYYELKEKRSYEYFDKETYHIYPIGYKELFKKYMKDENIKLPY